jgi:ADP-ribose pyrophosphatase YjhB (NUDIX family)
MEIKDKELHRITSTAIIHKDGKYLLLRRSLNKKAFPGKWTVPGGGLEIDDYVNSPKTTKDHWYFAIGNSLRREIKEECNLEVGKIKYLLDIAFIKPDGTPTIILSFYCPYESGEIKLDEDNIDYAWVNYEEAKKYDMVEGLLEEIEIIDKILNGHNEDEVQYNRKYI